MISLLGQRAFRGGGRQIRANSFVFVCLLFLFWLLVPRRRRRRKRSLRVVSTQAHSSLPFTVVSSSSTFSTMPTPFTHGQQPVSPALYLYPLNDSFVPKHIALLSQQRVKIGRQTNAKTVPGERNGYFDSKVLSRQHAEVWEQDGKVIPNLPLLSPSLHEDNFAPQIYIKDVKSSNGTFINGERLSGEGLESEPFELKSEDVVVSRFHPFATSCTATRSLHIQSGVWHRHCRRRQQDYHSPQGRCPRPVRSQ